MADTRITGTAAAHVPTPAASGTPFTDLHLAAALLSEVQTLLIAIARLSADPTIAELVAVTNDKLAEAQEITLEADGAPAVLALGAALLVEATPLLNAIVRLSTDQAVTVLADVGHEKLDDAHEILTEFIRTAALLTH